MKIGEKVRLFNRPEFGVGEISKIHDDGNLDLVFPSCTEVEKDQPAGAVHFPETPWRESSVTHFKRTGLVLCERAGGRVERGDCVFHLATDFEG